MWASSSWAGGRFGAGVFLSQCNIYWPAEHGVQAAIPQSIAFSIYGSAGHGTFSQLREKADGRVVGDWACCRRTPKPSQKIAPRRSRGHREGADMTKWCADATPTPPLHSSLRALSCANHSPELRTHTSSCALQLAGAYFLVLRGLPQADEIYEGSNLKSNTL